MRRNLSYLVIFFILFFIGGEAWGEIGPKIKIEKTFFTFGDIMEGIIEKKELTVENIGDEDLVIEKIYSNCGCTEVEISVKKLASKEKAKLKITYNTKGKIEGEDSKNIYIESNDPSNFRQKIIFTAQIIGAEKVKINEDKVYKIPLISSEDLFLRLEKKEKIIILDVREENEYLERHIPGAVWFPKSKFDKKDKITEKILNEIKGSNMVVAYCGAGHRSSYVTRKLRERGYNIFNLFQV